MKTGISIIIVNYNTSDVLHECIDSLFKFETAINPEIIVVDNNSGDNERKKLEHIKSTYNGIRIINLDKQVSFSEANNTGIKEAVNEFVLMMNPDIILTMPVLGKCLKAFEPGIRAGAVCPVLSGMDGIFQERYFQHYPGILQFIFFYSVAAKLFMNIKPLIYKFLYSVKNPEENSGLLEVEQIPCAFFFTRKEYLKEIGGMDADYELFFEDVDLSKRIGTNHKICLDTDLTVMHYGGAGIFQDSREWVYGRFISSMLVFCRKHYGNLYYRIMRFITHANSLIVILTENLKGLAGCKNNMRYLKHKIFTANLKSLN